MTKAIAALIIVIVLFAGWKLFEFWEKTKNEEDAARQQTVVTEDQLPGLPYQLAMSLAKARSAGATGLKSWLAAYGQQVKDPRKAWIELDYCLLISRDDLPEARRVFAGVKARTPQSSPVWPRIKSLEKTYE